MVTKVIADECIGCGICVDECASEALKIDGDIAIVDLDLCTDCGTCVEECPNDAIVIE